MTSFTPRSSATSQADLYLDLRLLGAEIDIDLDRLEAARADADPAFAAGDGKNEPPARPLALEVIVGGRPETFQAASYEVW